MPELTLFDLDFAGGIAAPKPPPMMWPCGIHELHDYWQTAAHVAECWGGICPDCGVESSGRGADDFNEYTAFHGWPAGYRNGYCYFQRQSWERIAECIACHSWWFSANGCWNEACRYFAGPRDQTAIHGANEDWRRYFYEVPA